MIPYGTRVGCDCSMQRTQKTCTGRDCVSSKRALATASHTGRLEVHLLFFRSSTSSGYYLWDRRFGACCTLRALRGSRKRRLVGRCPPCVRSHSPIVQHNWDWFGGWQRPTMRTLPDRACIGIRPQCDAPIPTIFPIPPVRPIRGRSDCVVGETMTEENLERVLAQLWETLALD